MKRLILLLLVFVCNFQAVADKVGNIIQVNRKLRMSRLEPLPPKEFYIDLGTRDGVKSGDVLEVFRMLPVVNSLSGGAWHLMKVTLGEIRLNFVGESTAIGRIANDREPSSLPSVEYQSFMVGDQVEVKAQLPSEAPRP